MAQDILNTPKLAVTIFSGSTTMLETEPTTRCFQITKNGEYIDLTEQEARKVARVILKALSAIYENQS